MFRRVSYTPVRSLLSQVSGYIASYDGFMPYQEILSHSTARVRPWVNQRMAWNRSSLAQLINEFTAPFP